MNDSIALLSLTAISLGFFHTLLGPDHYLPFIVMSKAKNSKLCGNKRGRIGSPFRYLKAQRWIKLISSKPSQTYAWERHAVSNEQQRLGLPGKDGHGRTPHFLDKRNESNGQQ